MDGNEIAEMFYGVDPDPLFYLLADPVELDWSLVVRGMEAACDNLQGCRPPGFFKVSKAKAYGLHRVLSTSG